jgi:hypothetical protein
MKDHGVGAMHTARQEITTTREALKPIPAKHVKTTGGHPKAKQLLAAAPKPLPVF